MYRNISAEFQTVNDADYVAQKSDRLHKELKEYHLILKTKKLK